MNSQLNDYQQPTCKGIEVGVRERGGARERGGGARERGKREEGGEGGGVKGAERRHITTL